MVKERQNQTKKGRMSSAEKGARVGWGGGTEEKKERQEGGEEGDDRGRRRGRGRKEAEAVKRILRKWR